MSGDIVARLRRAWAHPASVPEDEMRVLLSRAIEEIEVLRVLRDEAKVRGAWEAPRADLHLKRRAWERALYRKSFGA